MYLSLSLPVFENERKEIFNFKNGDCQEAFFELIENSSALSKCFENDENIQEQSNKWLKKLNGFFQQSFRKIRMTKKQKPTKISTMFGKKSALKEKMKRVGNDDDLKKELDDLEVEIGNEIANDNRNKVMNTFQALSDTDVTTNVNGMWGLKRKIFPKNVEQLPTAKKNVENRIISSQNELKKLYLDTFKHRLRHRPMNNDLKYLETIKEELCKRRLVYASLNKSEKWDKIKLHKILSSLKKNKSRDAQGLINEIFKPSVAGADLENSLLQMFNKMKDEISFPEFMKFVNIVCIYKGKGEKMDLENDRGIFIVNVLKSIFMKMVWSDIYDTLDENMSDSNIGGRKKKSIRNHVFIINGIINNVIHGNADPIDVEIIDYRQSLNDLFESGIQDDNLALINAANDENYVAVQTPAGLTERVPINRIVMQGEVTGPGQCSNMVDTFGKECLQESKLLYTYKDELGVPPLGMVDDVLAVSRCGVEAVEMNAFLNQKTRIKKLQFGPKKCHKLHVGETLITCPDLYIDEWKLEKKDEMMTGIENLVDVQTSDHKIELKEDDKYLGDIISVDGKNAKNIAARAAKAQGIIKQLKNILDEMTFGKFIFEVAVVLRNSIFINGILTNLEASYGLSDSDIEELEKCDEQLLRAILECPSKTPKEMLYLELGVTPIRFIIMARRMMFYQYILHEDSESLIYKFYKLQAKKPVKDDWSLKIKEDLQTLEIKLTEENIQKLSIESFKKIVKAAIQKAAFNYLIKPRPDMT